MIPIKPKTIRRITRLAKSLYPLLPRIPAPLPRPGSEAYWTIKTGDAAEAQRRQAEYERVDSRRLDKGTIRFWCEPYTWETRR